MLGGLEAFLKQTIQHRPGGASGLRRGVGVFDLTENLGFTDHLRVETGCDLEQVLDGVAAAEAQADGVEDVGIEILAGAKRRRDAGGGFRVQVAGRLIRQNKLGLIRQRPRNSNALLFPA